MTQETRRLAHMVNISVLMTDNGRGQRRKYLRLKHFKSINLKLLKLRLIEGETLDTIYGW